MSWAILTDESRDGFPVSVLYCNTSDVAFGPVMYDTDKDTAREFVGSLPRDPRLLTEMQLSSAWYMWQEEREEAEERRRRHTAVFVTRGEVDGG